MALRRSCSWWYERRVESGPRIDCLIHGCRIAGGGCPHDGSTIMPRWDAQSALFDLTGGGVRDSVFHSQAVVMTRLFAGFVAGLMAVAGAWASPASESGDAGTGDSKYGGTLDVAIHISPHTLDWQSTVSHPLPHIMGHVFEGLFGFTKEFDAAPELAESWETNADGTVWTIRLRPGVMFHNGDELSAEDVVASLERWRRVGPKGPALDELERFEIIDDLTLATALLEPQGPLPADADGLGREQGRDHAQGGGRGVAGGRHPERGGRHRSLQLRRVPRGPVRAAGAVRRLRGAQRCPQLSDRQQGGLSRRAAVLDRARGVDARRRPGSRASTTSSSRCRTPSSSAWRASTAWCR